MQIKKIFRIGWVLAKGNLKLKYEGSYLGVFWYLLKPLLLFGVLVLVFSQNIGKNIPYYPVYLLFGIIIWHFFSEATIKGMDSVKNKLMKSIKFPRESLVVSEVFTALVSHIFEIIVLGLFLIIFGLSPINLFFYLILLIFFFTFNLGVSFFLGAIAAYFKDLPNIWAIFLRVGWFATPIFYTTHPGSRFYIVHLFNPLYYFMTIARQVVIYFKTPPLWMIGGTFIFSMVSLGIGYFTFLKLKTRFAELI